jgi:hypothetical protein
MATNSYASQGAADATFVASEAKRKIPKSRPADAKKNKPLDVTSVSDVKAVKEPRRQSNAARNVDALQSIVIDAPDA